MAYLIEYLINFYTVLHPCATVHIMKSKLTDVPVMLNESYFLRNTSHYESKDWVANAAL